MSTFVLLWVVFSVILGAGYLMGYYYHKAFRE